MPRASKIAGAVLLLTGLTACATPVVHNTASGKPEATYDVPPEAIKPILVNGMINAGFAINRDTNYQIAFDKPVNNVLTAALLGSRLNAIPNERITYTIHSELTRIIAASPSSHLTFLVTQERGKSKPFTAPGFTNWFREMCREAGLPHCSAHGLRKALARRLAEGGCSEHEIAAITGHRSLQEVRRYTAAAQQVVLARRAMKAIPSPNGEQNLANPTKRLAKKHSK